MSKYIQIINDTPWKFFHELLMYLIKPFVLIYLKINGVKIGKGSKFYGCPKIYRHRGSTIEIGKNFECRSWWWSNPLGVNHPTIICTWQKDAKIIIRDDVGVTGGSIVSAKSIVVGRGVLIGANSTIIDTDFHPIKSIQRRYNKNNIRSSSVVVGNNVFIGTNVIVLKGVKINSNSIVPAGGVIKV